MFIGLCSLDVQNSWIIMAVLLEVMLKNALWSANHDIFLNLNSTLVLTSDPHEILSYSEALYNEESMITVCINVKGMLEISCPCDLLSEGLLFNLWGLARHK